MKTLDYKVEIEDEDTVLDSVVKLAALVNERWEKSNITVKVNIT